MREHKPCPVCGCKETYTDYQFNGEDEMRIDHCDDCDWPPTSPMSPQEWRAHPNNPMNRTET